MDIQHLVDRLEDLIDEGRHVPFTKFTWIDEERALEIIDQMRISVPEQIEKAARLINQRDRLMAQANEEAARVVDLARERSTELVERDAIVQTAKNRAANIIEQARREAEVVRGEADTYVMEVLKELEGQLIRNLTVVRNGIAKIMEERESSRARMQAVYEQAEADVAAVTQEMVEAMADGAAPPPSTPPAPAEPPPPSE
ncbi:MAG: ATP synthase F0 subunit B [Chloroflexi bacterium]|nr:ATP synthase F0 subunit B [Chloroflexota bacterium]